MAGEDDVDPEVLAPVRAVCLGLPEAYEEDAWIGVRWRIRQKTFAHLLVVDPGRMAAYTRAVGRDEPVTVVTFRAQGEELDVIRHAGPPYFYAGWGRDAVGIVVDEQTDWTEVAELLTESYCVLAPKKLVALVDRPDP